MELPLAVVTVPPLHIPFDVDGKVNEQTLAEHVAELTKTPLVQENVPNEV